jgi:hypothetical protein
MNQDIGYMQVHVKVYRNDSVYEEFAFNAYNEKHPFETDLVTYESQAIDDPAAQVEKVVTLLIKVRDDNYRIAMLIPVHQSEEWESTKISEEYIVMFYCIDGSKN